MNKVLILLSLLLLSLSLTAQELSVDSGRFQKGDDTSWSAFDYDDNTWQVVSFDKAWEDMGLDRVNGIGWYRLHVTIPSSLRKGTVDRDLPGRPGRVFQRVGKAPLLHC